MLRVPGRLGAVLARPKTVLASIAVMAAVSVSFVAPSTAEEADPVLARVNGSEIRASDVALAEEELGSNLPSMSGDARREYLVSFLADTMLVAQAAEAKKVADAPDFKRRLAFSRNKLLSEALLQQEAKASVTEAAMQKVYDEAAKQFAGQKEVRARHILLETEDEAKAVLAEIKAGKDFGELAKEKSKDPGATDGGDLGYFTQDQMVPEFANVAFSLSPGQVSDPVKSQFGWHVIKVEDKRDRAMPAFDKVKEQIEAYLTRKSQSEVVAKLREGAKIERVEAPSAPSSASPK